MRIQLTSFAFTLLLGLLATVPYSGIDINLPALSATGATLSASASDVGLTMSAFVLSLAVMPLMYGPASDRVGRKPIVLFGVLLFVMGSVVCALAPSLPVLLACRVVQGIGAAAMGTIFAIIRDLFDGNAARIKIANVMVAVNVATMVAPTAGATLLTLGNWRLIYAVQAGIGLILLLAVLFGLSESARIDLTLRPSSAIVSSYLRVLTHPVSFGYILVGAAAGAAVFAYVTGASLFFIGVVELRPDQYGLIFSAAPSWTGDLVVAE
jgi:MFS transporter, DHA1 family, multidrug resistance protein